MRLFIIGYTKTRSRHSLVEERVTTLALVPKGQSWVKILKTKKCKAYIGLKLANFNVTKLMVSDNVICKICGKDVTNMRSYCCHPEALSINNLRSFKPLHRWSNDVISSHE